MNCGDIGPLLSAYYDGEATAEERKLVEDCLASSPEARDLLLDYRRITGEFEALPRPTPPADLRRSVMNSVHQMSSATAARNAREATTRYNSTARTATGSIRRPLTMGGVLGQGFRFSALAAALVALLVILTLVFAQLNRNQPAAGVAAQQTATALALLVPSETPTPQATDTPFTLVGTATPQSITPPPTNTPGGPTDTPAPAPTTVAVNAPTNPPTNPPAVPTHIVAPPAPTDTHAPAATNTPHPDTPTSVPSTATSVPPTATSVPPTATSVPPTATSVPPTATSTPSSTPATTCAYQIVRGFGKIYSEHHDISSALGCPLEHEVAISGTVLGFQYGTMLWDSQDRLIYVFYTRDQKIEMFNENWDPSQGEPPAQPAPSDGFYTPQQGFGKVWYLHKMWETLGFATSPSETGVKEAVQSFEHGRMLWTDQKLIYVIVGDPAPNPDPNALQFAGIWRLYQDTFVDQGQTVPTPVPFYNSDGSIPVNQPSYGRENQGGGQQ